MNTTQLRHKFHILFKKGEYAAASFYCREWLRNPTSKEGLWFKALFDDEFLHWRYFCKSVETIKIKSNKDAKEFFIEEQKKVIEKGDKAVGSNRNYITALEDVYCDHNLVGFSSRFLVYQKMLGSKFTKDLDPLDKIAFIQVVDASNHLLYKFVNLIDPHFDYSFLWHHPKKENYKVPKILLYKWIIRYAICLFLFLPIDIFRILRTQII